MPGSAGSPGPCWGGMLDILNNTSAYYLSGKQISIKRLEGFNPSISSSITFPVRILTGKDDIPKLR